MLNNLTRLLTLLLAAYVLYLIIHSNFSLKEGFESNLTTSPSENITTPPPEYDPNDPNVFDQPYDPSKNVDGVHLDSPNLRKLISYQPPKIKTDPKIRPYNLEKKSILRKNLDSENKYLSKEKSNLENLNFLYPKSHVQTNFVGLNSNNKNQQIRAEPANPRRDQNPWTSKKIIKPKDN